MPSKSARMKSMVVNRPTCGGSKKAGLAPSSTSFYGQWFMQRRSAHKVDKYSYPESCIGAGSKFGLEYCIRYLKKHIKELNARINWGLDKVFPGLDPKEGPRIKWEKKYLVLGAWADIRGILQIFSTQPGVDPLHPFKSLDFWGIDYRNYHGRLRRCIQKVNASVPDGNINGTGEGHVIGLPDDQGWDLGTHMLGLFTQSEMDLIRNSPIGWRKYGVNCIGQNIIWYVDDDERLPTRTNSALYAFDGSDVICQNVSSYPFDTEFECKGIWNNSTDKLYFSLYQGAWPGIGNDGLTIEDARKFWSVGSYFVKKRKFNTILMNISTAIANYPNPGFNFIMTPAEIATLATYLPKDIILGAVVEANPGYGVIIPGEPDRQEPGGSNTCHKKKPDGNNLPTDNFGNRTCPYAASRGYLPEGLVGAPDDGYNGYGSLFVNTGGDPLDPNSQQGTHLIEGCPNVIENAMYLIGKANSYIKRYNELNPDNECPYFTQFSQDGENNGTAGVRYADWLHAVKTYILPNLPENYTHYKGDGTDTKILVGPNSNLNERIDNRMKAVRIGKAGGGSLNANGLYFEFSDSKVTKEDELNAPHKCSGGCGSTEGCKLNGDKDVSQQECLAQIPAEGLYSGPNLENCFKKSTDDDALNVGTDGKCTDGALFSALPETYWYIDGIKNAPASMCPIGYTYKSDNNKCISDTTDTQYSPYLPLGCNGSDHNQDILSANTAFDIYNYGTGSGAGTDTTYTPPPPPALFNWPLQDCKDWQQLGSDVKPCDGCNFTDISCFQNDPDYVQCLNDKVDACDDKLCCICQCNKTACGMGGAYHLATLTDSASTAFVGLGVKAAELQNIYLAYRNNFGGGTDYSLAKKFSSIIKTSSSLAPNPDNDTSPAYPDFYNTRGTLPMFSNEVVHQQYQQHPVTNGADLASTETVAGATQRQCLSQFPRPMNPDTFEPDPDKNFGGAPGGFCGTADFFGSWGADKIGGTYKSGWQHFYDFIIEFRDNAYRGHTDTDKYNRSQYALYDMQFLREDWITDTEPDGTNNLLTSYADTTTEGYFHFKQLPAVPLQRFKEVAALPTGVAASVISVGKKYLWMIDDTSSIWYTDADNLLTNAGDWTQKPGGLSDIAVAGDLVFGCNNVGSYVYQTLSDGSSGYNHIDQPADTDKIIVVGASDKYLCVITEPDNNIYYTKINNPLEPDWTQIPGGLVKVSVGGKYIYGCNSNGLLYRAEWNNDSDNEFGYWNLLNDRPAAEGSKLSVIRVAAEGNMVWVIAAPNASDTSGTAYFATTPDDSTNMGWIKIEDQYLPTTDSPPVWKKLNNIVNISISHLWCYVVDEDGNIWRQTSWPCDKYQDAKTEPTMNIQKFGSTSNGVGDYCDVVNKPNCQYW